MSQFVHEKSHITNITERYDVYVHNIITQCQSHVMQRLPGREESGHLVLREESYEQQ